MSRALLPRSKRQYVQSANSPIIALARSLRGAKAGKFPDSPNHRWQRWPPSRRAASVGCMRSNTTATGFNAIVAVIFVMIALAVGWPAAFVAVHGWNPDGWPDIARIPAQGPYGVYDITNNLGWVSVGTDHDTASFAVQAASPSDNRQ